MRIRAGWFSGKGACREQIRDYHLIYNELVGYIIEDKLSDNNVYKCILYTLYALDYFGMRYITLTCLTLLWHALDYFDMP